MEDRRARVSPREVERLVFLPEMSRPHWFTGDVKHDELSVAEPGVNSLAVCHRTRCRQVALLMYLRQFALRRNLVLPQKLAVSSTKCRHDQENPLIHSRGSRAAKRSFAGCGRIAALDERRMIASPQRARADLIGETDTLSPHPRGRNAEPRKWCLPGDVLVTTPLHRESCFIAYSSAVRASPLR